MGRGKLKQINESDTCISLQLPYELRCKNCILKDGSASINSTDCINAALKLFIDKAPPVHLKNLYFNIHHHLVKKKHYRKINSYTNLLRFKQFQPNNKPTPKRLRRLRGDEEFIGKAPGLTATSDNKNETTNKRKLPFSPPNPKQQSKYRNQQDKRSFSSHITSWLSPMPFCRKIQETIINTGQQVRESMKKETVINMLSPSKALQQHPLSSQNTEDENFHEIESPKLKEEYMCWNKNGCMK